MARKTPKTEVAAEGKKRTVKIIFNPLSFAFYAGLGYMIYRQFRKRRVADEKLPQGA